MKKCATPNCKHKIKVRNYCQTCRSRKYKQKHVLKYVYHTWKSNAKRRGKEFTVTFDEFIEFCKETNYDSLRGKTALSLSIDRRDPCKGYHKDNIRAITLRDNSLLNCGIPIDLGEDFTKVEDPVPF